MPKRSGSSKDKDLLGALKKYRVISLLLLALVLGQNLLDLLELPSRFFNLPVLYSSEEANRIKIAENDLRQLKNGVSISFVESLFGKAKYETNLQDNCGLPENEHLSACLNNIMQKEYVFHEPDFILIAVTDKNSNLIMYSITTLNENFKPKLPVFFSRFINFYEIQLGETLFSELPSEDPDSFIRVFREGMMSGNGASGGYNKSYVSDDYAATDNYVFQSSYETHALSGYVNRDCDFLNVDSIFGGFDDKEDLQNYLEFERRCVVSTIKYVSHVWSDDSLINGPEFYTDLSLIHI